MPPRSISSMEFAAYGLCLIKKKSNISTAFEQLCGSANRQLGQSEINLFSSHFGVQPKICKLIWDLLRLNDLMPNRGLPQHLLWALLFLKQYTNEKSLASLAGVGSVKTYKKWVWRFVRGISALKRIVVSSKNEV